MKVQKLSFVIPCYNSERTISKVIDDIVNTVSEKNPYEIICVNDCSADNVYSVLKELAHGNKHLKVVNLARNFGQHSALMAGYNYVTGDIVICLDDDGQTNPKDCYTLIGALNDEIDIAIAKYPSKKESPFRLFGSWTAKKMGQWLCAIPKNIELNSYFACKRFVIDEVIKYDNAYPYIAGLLLRVTKKVTNVTVPHHNRAFGKSGYTFKKLLNLWMNGFTAFSVKPLRISSFIGAFLAGLGFLYLIFLFIKKIINPDVPMGYSSLMCTVLFVGGMLMLMLGCIGEYVGRIYICLNKSPQYVVRNTVNVEDEK